MTTIEGLQNEITAKESYINKLQQDIRNVEATGGDSSSIKGVLNTQQNSLQSSKESLYNLQQQETIQEQQLAATPITPIPTNIYGNQNTQQTSNIEDLNKPFVKTEIKPKPTFRSREEELTTSTVPTQSQSFTQQGIISQQGILQKKVQKYIDETDSNKKIKLVPTSSGYSIIGQNVDTGKVSLLGETKDYAVALSPFYGGESATVLAREYELQDIYAERLAGVTARREAIKTAQKVPSLIALGQSGYSWEAGVGIKIADFKRKVADFTGQDFLKLGGNEIVNAEYGYIPNVFTFGYSLFEDYGTKKGRDINMLRGVEAYRLAGITSTLGKLPIIKDEPFTIFKAQVDKATKKSAMDIEMETNIGAYSGYKEGEAYTVYSVSKAVDFGVQAYSLLGGMFKPKDLGDEFVSKTGKSYIKLSDDAGYMPKKGFDPGWMIALSTVAEKIAESAFVTSTKVISKVVAGTAGAVAGIMILDAFQFAKETPERHKKYRDVFESELINVKATNFNVFRGDEMIINDRKRKKEVIDDVFRKPLLPSVDFPSANKNINIDLPGIKFEEEVSYPSIDVNINVNKFKVVDDFKKESIYEDDYGYEYIYDYGYGTDDIKIDIGGGGLIPGIGMFDLPNLGGGGRGRDRITRTPKTRLQKSYAPDIKSVLFNITGKKPIKTITGFEPRPIPVTLKKKKKKVTRVSFGGITFNTNKGVKKSKREVMTL